MYPGCSITTNSTKGLDGEKNTVNLKSKLYLNRYTPSLYYLAQPISGIISEEMNIVYPIHMANDLMYKKENILNKEVLNSNNYVKTNYFPNLHWKGTLHNLGSDNGEYNFEAVEPLSYNLEKNKQKLILGLNPNNQFANMI